MENYSALVLVYLFYLFLFLFLHISFKIKLKSNFSHSKFNVLRFIISIAAVYLAYMSSTIIYDMYSITAKLDWEQLDFTNVPIHMYFFSSFSLLILFIFFTHFCIFLFMLFYLRLAIIPYITSDKKKLNIRSWLILSALLGFFFTILTFPENIISFLMYLLPFSIPLLLTQFKPFFSIPKKTN